MSASSSFHFAPLVFHSTITTVTVVLAQLSFLNHTAIFVQQHMLRLLARSTAEQSECDEWSCAPSDLCACLLAALHE